jgi:hypothetical protein
VLLAFEWDQCIDEKSEGVMTARQRTVSRMLGTVHFGDKYYGQVTFGDGILSIGPDVGYFNRGQVAVKEIAVEYAVLVAGLFICPIPQTSRGTLPNQEAIHSSEILWPPSQQHVAPCN